MEAAIILDGLKILDSESDIRIYKIIADGDSSVYYNLINNLDYGDKI